MQQINGGLNSFDGWTGGEYFEGWRGYKGQEGEGWIFSMLARREGGGLREEKCG